MEAAERPDRKRLHITPFNPTLLDRFIPPSLHPLASGISFHTVETYPERGFGYVELPAMEAEKLKKKLNGMTLKGAKVKIEDAKPEKKRKAGDETEEERQVRKKAKKEKRKREEGVLSSHELKEGRRVKRGWTDDASEKKRDKKAKKAKAADDGLEGKKLRFRTSVPPNKASMDGKTKPQSEDKKARKDKPSKKKTVVQEFSKTQKPSTTSEGPANGKRASRFEDGKGWVDEEGDVVETAPVSKKPKRVALPETTEAKASTTVVAEQPTDDTDTDSDEEVSSVVSSDSPSEPEPESESGDEALDQSNVQPEEVHTSPIQAVDASNFERPSEGTQLATEVHPLEALFKRPVPKPESASKPKPSPIDTSFSFFTSGGATDDVEAEGAAYPPQTPHTKEDLEWRSIRSAAPTPDTAVIGKRFDFSLPRDGEEDDEDEDEDEIDRDELTAIQEDVTMSEEAGQTQTGNVNGGKEESAFRTWFYDNRGDLNRGWKKRRRDERKQKRQRENRRLSRRVA